MRARVVKAPKKPLKRYDMEISPYCRLVREALCDMDLDVMILPCPVGGTRYRRQASRLLLGTRCPLLVDNNIGVAIYKSLDILAYPEVTYGLLGGRPAQGGRGHDMRVRPPNLHAEHRTLNCPGSTKVHFVAAGWNWWRLMGSLRQVLVCRCTSSTD